MNDFKLWEPTISGKWEIDIRVAVEMIMKLTLSNPLDGPLRSQAELDARCPKFIEALRLCGIRSVVGSLTYLDPDSIHMHGWGWTWADSKPMTRDEHDAIVRDLKGPSS